MEQELAELRSNLQVRVVDDLSSVHSLMDRQLVIIDLSVYSPGIIDRIEKFKTRFPKIELVAVTYSNDEFIDQMLIKRGIDQVCSREDLSDIVARHLAPNLQTTG
ncbi:hypothetical protein [Reichenbachiella sp.]|uniref:hypothetical protein n=1 Tax=Reichenbachiella sp. TaxID=2184521 RepID=UPI003B5C0EA2